jgi:glycosyltransferase involved in cell wall biosynthesis
MNPLHITFAHNRYLIRGGEDESREQEMAYLRAQGHRVSEYVVDNRDVGKSSYLAAGLRSVWNRREHDRMCTFLRAERPEILKVDNYFPLLSPAIFDAARAEGVATILSVRNYRLVCPAATLYRDGAPCHDCVGHRFAMPAIRHSCYRDSSLQSAAVAASNAWAHLRGTWQNSVDQYIAVSRFVKEQLIQGGLPADRISVKPNCIADSGPGDGAGNYAIFVGRLTAEKGVHVLLDAWRQIGSALPLKIIGEGPLEATVRESAQQLPGVEYLGRRPISEVCDYLGRAAVLIFPSEWLEPFGRTIVEAYSKGTPVIAAGTLPMRDMIEPEVTGLLYTPGRAEALAAAVHSLLADPQRLQSMRVQARARYLRDYSVAKNYTAMMEIFSSVLSGHGRTGEGSRRAAMPAELHTIHKEKGSIPLRSAVGGNGMRDQV